MIECAKPDEHFPEMTTLVHATGICIICYTPVVLQDTLDQAQFLHRYNQIVLR
jgi:hypothetical protein